MVNGLKIERGEDPSPDVQGVIKLRNIFAAIVEFSISQQESVAAECQVLLVVVRNSIRNVCNSGSIKVSLPALAVSPQT
jgi:hypothetical protein